MDHPVNYFKSTISSDKFSIIKTHVHKMYTNYIAWLKRMFHYTLRH